MAEREAEAIDEEFSTRAVGEQPGVLVLLAGGAEREDPGEDVVFLAVPQAMVVGAVGGPTKKSRRRASDEVAADAAVVGVAGMG